MVSIGFGNIGLDILILGIILILLSLAPTSLKGDLMRVGEVLAILGAIVFVILLVF